MKRLSPAKAIRAMCLQCMGGSRRQAEECHKESSCLLWRFRLCRRGQGRPSINLIRDYCLHCNGVEVNGEDGIQRDGEGYVWALNEAKGCTDEKCPFHPYRPGGFKYTPTGKPFSSSRPRGKLHFKAKTSTKQRPAGL